MNVRPPATPFVGRVAEIVQVATRLQDDDTRLVTLVGPAGVGKTRLALQVAAQIEAEAGRRVLVAELAAVGEAAGVVPAILRQIGAADTGARDPIGQLVDALRDRRTLLVLDNFEHVVAAASTVAALLDACGELKALVTSRRPLRMQSEQVVIVEPLLSAEAVTLLVTRMRAADSTFAPQPDSAPALADICRRLDGLPLAIELVAPRVRVLPVTAIAAAMEQRLPLLVRGPLDSPQRHRTMRDALAWSFDLLDSQAARLLRHAAVFTGDWTLDAARAVAGDAAILDLHEDLVMHSLVVQRGTDDDARFAMLEVVREFAREQLDASGETQPAERRHAEHFLALAERAAQVAPTNLGGALACLERDRANLHAALRWAIAHDEAEIALRFCVALRMLWYVRGSLQEGRTLTDAALGLPAPPLTRARALAEASTLARQHGDFARGYDLAAEAVSIARAGDDIKLCAYALMQQGFAAHLQENAAAARACLDESVDLARTIGDDLALARGLHHLGIVAMHLDGDARAASALQQQALTLFRALGNHRHVATSLISMTQVELARRELPRAHDAITEAMSIVLDLGDMPLLIYALHNAAALAAARHEYERALRLLGAVDRLERLTGAAPWPAMTRTSSQWLDAAVRSVGQRRATNLRRRGAELSAVEAVAYAAATDQPGGQDSLSRREQEIAELVAEGFTNREIAERLVISERTVDGHVARVLDKLGFRSRAQIATWVSAER